MVVRDLGHVNYLPTVEAMKVFTQARGVETPDELWVLEHPAVFTQGIAGKEEHLLAPGEIEVIRTDRGGQVTYHGPGQIVVYVLCDIRRAKLGVRDLVTGIEQAIIAFLSEFGLVADSDPKAPGVYVSGEKIASLGLKISRGSSYHGLALNVNPDLEHFGRINPCGYAGLRVTSLAQLLGEQCPPQADAAERFVEHLRSKLPLQ
ncbi:MAG: lipoyl(octanoyl) transferase LipB [Pseudomonadota bacterium]|nr:lipoyl(octanoyl) transferase LipB [Pseudomonadota bacterium]